MDDPREFIDMPALREQLDEFLQERGTTTEEFARSLPGPCPAEDYEPMPDGDIQIEDDGRAGRIGPDPGMDSFRKNDSADGKPRIELIDPDFIEGVARVLMFGTRKYAEDNWKLMVESPYQNRRRVAAAAIRHNLAILRGELIDPETGEDHNLHAACCAMFGRWLNAREVES